MVEAQLRRIARILLLGLCATLGGSPSAEARLDYPLWPGEWLGLLEVVAADESPIEDRRRALQSLSEFPDAIARRGVRVALESGDPVLQRDAMRVCGERIAPWCRGHARALLERETPVPVVLLALQAVADPLDATGFEALARALRARDESVREAAAEHLVDRVHPPGELRERSARLLPHLLDASANVRRSLVCVLGQLGEESVIDPLGALLFDPDPAVRLEVVTALGRIGAAASFGVLKRTLNTAPDRELARAALAAIIQLEGSTVEAHLIDLAHDRWIPEKLEYVDVLNLLGRRQNPGPAFRRAMVGLLARPGVQKPRLRAEVVRLLAQLGSTITEELVAALAAGVPPSIELDLRRLERAALADDASPSPQNTIAQTGAIPRPSGSAASTRSKKAYSPTLMRAIEFGRSAAAGGHPWSRLTQNLRVAVSLEANWHQALALALALSARRTADGRPSESESPRGQPSVDSAIAERLARWANGPGSDPGLRCLALMAYALADQRAEQLIADLSDAPSPTLRACSAAASALTRASATATDQILRAAHDQRAQVRRAALTAARGLGSSLARRELGLQTASDTDPEVRRLSSRLRAKEPVMRHLEVVEAQAARRTWAFYDVDAGKFFTLTPVDDSNAIKQ